MCGLMEAVLFQNLGQYQTQQVYQIQDQRLATETK